MDFAIITNADGINEAQFNGYTWPATGFQQNPPLLYHYLRGADLQIQNIDYSPATNSLNQYSVPYGAVVEMYIVSQDEGEHPFHMHGHNFWVVATSANQQAASLYANNYVIRDTVSIPAAIADLDGNIVQPGWVRIRFIANNPGVWLFHCHIEWHMDAGLVAVMIEAPEMLPALAAPADSSQICSAQSTYLSAVQDQLLADEGIEVFSLSSSTIGFSFLSCAIIVSESTFALVIWRLGILPYILLEVLAVMIGTLLGATFAELIPDMFTAVFVDGSLIFELVVALILLGILFSYCLEKFLKRGKANKFIQLIAFYTAQGKFSSVSQSTITQPIDKSNAATVALLPANQPGNSSSASHSPSHGNDEKEVSRTESHVTTAETGSDQSQVRLMHATPGTIQRSSSEVSNASLATDSDTLLGERQLPRAIQVPEGVRVVAPISSIDEEGSEANSTSSPPYHSADKLGTVVDLPDEDFSSHHDADAETSVTRPAEGGNALRTMEKLRIMEEERRLALGTDKAMIILMLTADMFHNFSDGATITAAWLTSNTAGIATTIGIFMEEFPHLVGMFAVFVAAGATWKKALLLNVLGAFPFLLGWAVIIGIASIPNIDISQIDYLICFAIGTFLYISLVDLLPVLTQHWQGYRRTCIQIALGCAGAGIQAGVCAYNASQHV